LTSGSWQNDRALAASLIDFPRYDTVAKAAKAVIAAGFDLDDRGYDGYIY